MELAIITRELTGKKVASLRKQWQVPAIIYGKHLKNPLVIACDKNAFLKAYASWGSSTALTLTWSKIKELALIKDIQLDPVTDYVLHIDFHAVKADEKVTTQIPVVLIGIAPIEKLAEGRVQLIKDHLEVEAFPQDLPKEITIDISALDKLHQTIQIKEIVVSKNITLLEDPEETIITVVAFAAEEIEEVATTDAAGNLLDGTPATDATATTTEGTPAPSSDDKKSDDKKSDTKKDSKKDSK